MQRQNIIILIQPISEPIARGNDGKVNPCEFCGKEKEIRFFELDGFHDKEAFSLGQKANFEDKNPFKQSTNSWFNWNRGKNTNNNK